MGRAFAVAAENLAEYPSSAKVFLKNGRPYEAGDLLVQKDLAGSLRRVAEGGAEEFYRGGLARDIAKAFREAGGLLDEVGNVIDSINLSTEYDHLIAQPWIHGGMKVKIEQIKDLLDRLPLESSVSITRPADLAKELFTNKGSGTLVRKGEKVLRATAWNELDLQRLKGLIESSFGRALVPDYFEKTKLLRAYVSENYRTAVILTDEAEGVYLDKFAVLDDAQGEGLGRAVLNVMLEETPQLFWRSRHGNPINHFYYAESDGCYKQDHWKVFWFGADGIDRIKTYVDHCAQRTPSLQG